MSSGAPVPTNLQDMIALIDADKLQMELFSLYAPRMQIDWAALSGKRTYSPSMQTFRGKTGGAIIALPEENRKLGDRAWISSISVSLDGNLLPTTYRGNETEDIYDQMTRQIDPKQFPELIYPERFRLKKE